MLETKLCSVDWPFCFNMKNNIKCKIYTPYWVDFGDKTILGGLASFRASPKV